MAIIFLCSQILGEEINGKGYECPGPGVDVWPSWYKNDRKK